jgi:hypothetical protein
MSRAGRAGTGGGGAALGRVGDPLPVLEQSMPAEGGRGHGTLRWR